MGKPTKNSSKKNMVPVSGMWLLGSKTYLKVTSHTAKSVTLEVGGVSLGKHFGEILNERKPS